MNQNTKEETVNLLILGCDLISFNPKFGQEGSRETNDEISSDDWTKKVTEDFRLIRNARDIVDDREGWTGRVWTQMMWRNGR